MCERCKARGIYKPGYIVHHKEYITPGNISNPNITLNLDNLEYVCEDCHNKEHHRNDKKKRYAFDEAGNLISPLFAQSLGRVRHRGREIKNTPQARA